MVLIGLFLKLFSLKRSRIWLSFRKHLPHSVAYPQCVCWVFIATMTTLSADVFGNLTKYLVIWCSQWCARHTVTYSKIWRYVVRYVNFPCFWSLRWLLLKFLKMMTFYVYFWRLKKSSVKSGTSQTTILQFN